MSDVTRKLEPEAKGETAAGEVRPASGGQDIVELLNCGTSAHLKPDRPGGQPTRQVWTWR